MNSMQLQRRRVLGLLVALMAFLPPAQAQFGVREAAVSLERQLLISGNAQPAELSFQLPLEGSSVVLEGRATLEPLDAQRCRRTLEIVHEEPFERRGLRITSLSRRSVQEGACQNFGNSMVAQADASARSIAEQIGLGNTEPDAIPGVRVQVSHPAVAPATSRSGEAVQLTVRERAVIRDAPSREGEKLSRAEKGTRLDAHRLAGNPEWFVLDGGMRFISATVVEVRQRPAALPVSGSEVSRVRLQVKEHAVLRNAPSFKGQKVASLDPGVERIARKVPDSKGSVGWFELTDGSSGTPLYIHESVVSLKSAEGRQRKRL